MAYFITLVTFVSMKMALCCHMTFLSVVIAIYAMRFMSYSSVWLDFVAFLLRGDSKTAVSMAVAIENALSNVKFLSVINPFTIWCWLNRKQICPLMLVLRSC